MNRDYKSRESDDAALDQKPPEVDPGRTSRSASLPAPSAPSPTVASSSAKKDLATHLESELSGIEERLKSVGGQLRIGWLAWTKPRVRTELRQAKAELDEIHLRLEDAKSEHKLSSTQIDKLRRHLNAVTELHRAIYEMAAAEGVFR